MVSNNNFRLYVIYNYIILSIIGVIALKVAWNFVGKLYDYGIIIGKSSGSIIHWIIRLMIFTVLFYILGGIIWLTKLVYLYKTESIIILASSVIILILYKNSKITHKKCKNKYNKQ